jgi:hypothetical protein
MKKSILASAWMFILSAGGTFAQAQPAPGGWSSANVGPVTRVAIRGAAPAGRWIIWNGIPVWFGPSVRGVPGHICDNGDNGKIC